MSDSTEKLEQLMTKSCILVHLCTILGQLENQQREDADMYEINDFSLFTDQGEPKYLNRAERKRF